MAPRRKVVEEQEPIQEQPQTYEFEPVDENLRSRLNVWGNSTQLTIQQLQERYPGWATFLTDVFTTVGGIIEANSQ